MGIRGGNTAASSGAPVVGGYRSGAYVQPPGTTSALTLSNNTIYGVPFVLPSALTIDAISLIVNTAASGTNVQGRLGVYTLDTLTLTLLADAGAIDLTTTGQKIALSSVTLPAGRIVVAMVQQTADSLTSGAAVYSRAGTPYAYSGAHNSNTAYVGVVAVSTGPTALPTSAAAILATTGSAPSIGLRVA